MYPHREKNPKSNGYHKFDKVKEKSSVQEKVKSAGPFKQRVNYTIAFGGVCLGGMRDGVRDDKSFSPKRTYTVTFVSIKANM